MNATSALPPLSPVLLPALEARTSASEWLGADTGASRSADVGIGDESPKPPYLTGHDAFTVVGTLALLPALIEKIATAPRSLGGPQSLGRCVDRRRSLFFPVALVAPHAMTLQS